MLHYLHFSRQLWEKLPFQNESILNIHIKVYMRCLHQCWFLKKIFGGKQLTVLPPWLHPVCDVAKTGLL